MKDQRELVRLAANGDAQAFETLVGIYQQKVFQLCYRMCRDTEDAADLTQEAFLKAWRGLSQYQFEAEFSTWLFRLTKNVCLDFLRRKNRSSAVPQQLIFAQDSPESQALADPKLLPEEQVLREEFLRSLEQAFAELSEEFQEILNLRVMDDLSYEEIAELLGIRLGTVKSRLARARLRLKNLLMERNILPPSSSKTEEGVAK